MSTQQQGVPGSQNSPPSSGTNDTLQMGNEDEQQQTPPQGEIQSSPTPEFNDPLLKGKSPAEIEQMFGQLKATVREQGKVVQDLTSRQGVTPQGRPADVPQPREEVTDDAFWQSPVKVLRQEMERMIQPFKEDLAQSRQAGAADRLRQEFPLYSELEPQIDLLMAQTNQPRTYESLRGAYLMVRGYMAEQGQTFSQQPQQAIQQPQVPAPPPQHRPSTAPVPQQGTPGGKKRQLTESEKHIARVAGYTDEQYLALIELDEEDVVTSNIGQRQT